MVVEEKNRVMLSRTINLINFWLTMLSDDTQCSNRSLDLISNSRYYQPYNSYNVSSENLVLDQIIIHLIIFFFIIPILKSLVVPVI